MIVAELQERIDSLHKLGSSSTNTLTTSTTSKSNNNNNDGTAISNSEDDTTTSKIEDETETENVFEEEEGQQDSKQQQQQQQHQKVFEENLLKLNEEWNEAVQGIELMCVQNEHTANKWWDFGRLKKKVLRWIEKKERDAKDNEQEGGESYETVLKNKDKYKVSMEIYPFSRVSF